VFPHVVAPRIEKITIVSETAPRANDEIIAKKAKKKNFILNLASAILAMT